MIFGWIGAVCVGAILGLLGGGGSILTVPILVYLMNVDPVRATAYSLFIVGITSFVGALGYLRRDQIDVKTGVWFALPAFAGVFLTRKYLVPNLPDPVFTLGGWELSKGALLLVAFALMMIAASWSMIRGRKDTTPDPLPPNQVAAGAIVIGVFTGLVGAGGGFLIVPALAAGAQLPMKTAVGTSLAIIAFNSTFGFLGDLGHINVQWPLLLGFCAASIVGILVGSHFASQVPGKKLKPIFGWFVLVAGTVMLVKELL